MRQTARNLVRLTTTDIQALVDQWGEIERQAQKVDAQRVKAIEPVLERHNEELTGVAAKHDAKLVKLREQQRVIEEQIRPALEKRPKDVVITGEIAEAVRKTETKVGPRQINGPAFMEMAQTHGQKMWDCIVIGIKKAEDLIGKQAVDKISKKETTTEVKVELRLKD